MYVCGSMVEGSEILSTQFAKLWEIQTKLGYYVSFILKPKINVLCGTL